MELKDTIKGMLSDDYRERFKAEYYQLKIRTEKLKAVLERLRNKTADFEPDCPIELLEQQLLNMREYLYTLETRARYENINLNEGR